MRGHFESQLSHRFCWVYRGCGFVVDWSVLNQAEMAHDEGAFPDTMGTCYTSSPVNALGQESPHVPKCKAKTLKSGVP